MSRILFVDDDLRLLSALRRTFKRLNPAWDCVFLTSAEEALNSLEDQTADVVVTDMTMGGMNGLELARRIHALYPKIPTIILTGTADLNDAVEAINEAKVFQFYTKPCASERLAEGIVEALKTSPATSDRAGNSPATLGQTAFELVPLGIIVVDVDANVEFLNDRAAKLISQKDGLLMNSAGVLRAARSDLTSELHQSIANVILADPLSTADVALALPRTSGKRDLNLFIASSRRSDEPNSAAHATIFVTDPELPVEPSEKALREMFDLTYAEARLVRALMQESELKDAAEASNITLQTARSYLKRIFEKTGTSRQAQLVKLILTSPAILDRSTDK